MPVVLLAQPSTNLFWVYLRDKGPEAATAKPALSPMSLHLRKLKSIKTDGRDVLVSSHYLDSLEALGVHIRHTSRWLNAVSIEATEAQTARIRHLGFVRSVEPLGVWRKQLASILPVEPTEKTGIAPGDELVQLQQLGIDKLQALGYTGRGVRMAVFDSGFERADTAFVFDALHARGGVIGTRDFVNPGESPYVRGEHGTMVLSLVVGQAEGQLRGAAPDVDVLLLRTENDASETLVEEDNWVAAAEYADSIGVDIFQTSLGYSTFDNGIGNHTYADLDGNTTVITRAADLAASRGILVVNSLGNEGNQPWKYLIAPADGDSVLAVGAVDNKGVIVNFSSYGPRVDGRTKPDVVAMGFNDILYKPSTRTITTGNGTSFSAPLISGLAACLLQRAPNSTGMELYSAIVSSTDRYWNPDVRYGNGLPNALLASGYLDTRPPDAKPTFSIYPNPVTDRIFIRTDSSLLQANLIFELLDHTGRVVMREEYAPSFSSGRNVLEVLFPRPRLTAGLYYATLWQGRTKRIAHAKLAVLEP
jgi:serine protease AprX